ncbi:MAG: transcriptional regulator [Burkholderiales bacterium]
MNTPDQNRNLIKRAGGPAVVAELFGKSPQAVIHWYTNGIPAERVLPIAKLTDFKLTPHELRPDLYPNPSDGLPSDQTNREAA